MTTLKEHYYALFTDHSGIPGMPDSLDIKLFETAVQGDPFGDENRVYYEWMKPAFPDYTLKSEFYLYIKKVEEFKFDYYRYSNNFIVSERFLSRIDNYHVPYVKASIRIFYAADHQEIKFQKRYFFVKFEFTKYAVDRELSIFEDALSDAGQPIVHKDVHYVDRYDKLVLNPTNIQHEVFLAKDNKLAFNLLCGDAFREEIISSDLYGIIIKPLSEFIDFSENHGELGQESYQRNKKRQSPSAAVIQESTEPIRSNKPHISFRLLNKDESREIDRLSAAGKGIVMAGSKDDGEILARIAAYIDQHDNKSEIHQRRAFELGSLYGDLIVEKYKWQWCEVNIDHETAYCVRSPDQQFACKVHHYLYALMQPGRKNNIKLLFNMMGDLRKENRSDIVTFLN